MFFGAVAKDETIMLNITGGGEERAKSEQEIVYARPHLVLDPSLTTEEIISEIDKIY